MSDLLDAIRATAQAEAERRWPDRMGREDDDSPFMLDFSEERTNFVENAMWLVSRITREKLVEVIAVEFHEGDPQSAADAVLALLATS